MTLRVLHLAEAAAQGTHAEVKKAEKDIREDSSESQWEFYYISPS
jgi:hypothetical protein